MFESPGAIFFCLGPLTIRWYGVMIAIGFLFASFAATKLAKKMDADGEKILNLCLVAFLGGIIGARLYFALLNWQSMIENPIEIIQTWKGGLSIHGGLIGGLIAGVVYAKMYKLSILKSADIITACLPLAQAIGRWGNFFNSEAFGLPVGESFPLKLYIAPQLRPIEYQHNNYFHPTFLYESIWDLLMFALLYFGIIKQFSRYPGLTACLYLILYSIGRILIEPIRLDSIMIDNTKVPIVASIVSLVIGLVIGCILFVKGKKAAVN